MTARLVRLASLGPPMDKGSPDESWEAYSLKAFENRFVPLTEGTSWDPVKSLHSPKWSVPSMGGLLALREMAIVYFCTSPERHDRTMYVTGHPACHLSNKQKFLTDSITSLIYGNEFGCTVFC